MGDRAAHAWYEAKLAAEQREEYVADVTTAWDLAEQASAVALREDGRSSSLGLEVRYACINASLTAMGLALPTALLLALVEHEVWTAARALSHARQRIHLPDTGGVDYDPDEDVQMVSGLTALGYGDLAAEHTRTRGWQFCGRSASALPGARTRRSRPGSGPGGHPPVPGPARATRWAGGIGCNRASDH